MTEPLDRDTLRRWIREAAGEVLRQGPEPQGAAAPAGRREPEAPGPAEAPSAPGEPPIGRVALGSDHGGFELKERLKAILSQQGYQVVDCGCYSTESVDYPDYAHAVAQRVAGGECLRGIMIDGVGIGSVMAANKVPGVRAATCWDVTSARNAREHNDANVLTLGGQMMGLLVARQVVKAFLETEFGGGRHARRVEKIMDIEARYRGGQ